MTGTSSQTTTTYTSPKKVFEFVQYYTEVPLTIDNVANTITGSEAVGTGDASRTRWALVNPKVVPGTDDVYLAGVSSSAYTIDEDNGLITFASPPAVVAITAAYRYSDVRPSVVTDFILRAEDEIDRRTGRVFAPAQTTTQYYDGTSKGITNVFSYQSDRFIDEADQFEPPVHDLVAEKYVMTLNYPIVSVNLLAINEVLDQKFEETYTDSTQAFGLTTYVAQSFKAGFSKPLVRVALQLKYNTGTRGAITVGLYSNSTGPGTVLATATIAALSASNTTNQIYDAIFTTPYTLTAGTTYWIVVYSAASGAVNTYYLGIDASSPSYANGNLSISTNSGVAWTADTSKCAVFNTYCADDVATYDDYRIEKDGGRVVLTTQSGLKMTRGIQNIVLNYSYGYATVPKIVEDIATKLAALYFIESKLLGAPAQLSIPEGNVRQLRQELDRALESLGERLEVRII